MTRSVLAVLVLGLWIEWAVPAQEVKALRKPIGAWQRTHGDNKVTFHIRPDAIHLTVTNTAGGSMHFDADYGVARDGVLFGRVHKVERKAMEGGPEEGGLFSFAFTADKNSLIIKDLRGADSDEARQLIEGEYKGVAEGGNGCMCGTWWPRCRGRGAGG